LGKKDIVDTLFEIAARHFATHEIKPFDMSRQQIQLSAGPWLSLPPTRGEARLAARKAPLFAARRGGNFEGLDWS